MNDIICHSCHLKLKRKDSIKQDERQNMSFMPPEIETQLLGKKGFLLQVIVIYLDCFAGSQ